MNLLKFLKSNTKLSIDSANLDFVKKNNFDSLTSNPSLILKSLIENSFNDVLKFFLLNNNKKILLDSNIEISFYDKFLIFIISKFLPFINGRISVEIPARVSYNYNYIIIYSKKIIFVCNSMGIDNEKILVKIPATDQGIKAASKLKKIGIECNLTLIFDINQVKKCFDEGVYLISPFVGRVSDNIFCEYDAGISFVKNIYNYKIFNNYKTKIMAASFRNINQIINLFFCDFLTISPLYFNKLKLNNINIKIFKTVNNINCSKYFNLNLISSKLLLKGINQFEKDHIKLIKIISIIINNL